MSGNYPAVLVNAGISSSVTPIIRGRSDQLGATSVARSWGGNRWGGSRRRKGAGKGQERGSKRQRSFFATSGRERKRQRQRSFCNFQGKRQRSKKRQRRKGAGKGQERGRKRQRSFSDAGKGQERGRKRQRSFFTTSLEKKETATQFLRTSQMSNCSSLPPIYYPPTNVLLTTHLRL